MQYAHFKQSLFMETQSEFAEFIGINDKTHKIAFELELPSRLPLSSFVLVADNDESTKMVHDNNHYIKFLDEFMKQSKGLFNKYLAFNATVFVDNFNLDARYQILRMFEEYDDMRKVDTKKSMSKGDVMGACFDLLQQFEKAAFLVSLQLNRKFWLYSKLERLAVSNEKEKSQRGRSKSYSRSRSKSKSKSRSRSRSNSRSKSKSRSKSSPSILVRICEL